MENDISNFTIIKILKNFSSKEIRDFEKLIRSPFFNNHSTVIILFEELKKFYPDFSDHKLTKKFLFNVVNKGKRYNDLLFQKYMSRLKKLCEEYLNILEIRSEPQRKDIYILLQLSKLGIQDVVLKKISEIEKSFTNNVSIDLNFFFHRYLFEELKILNFHKFNVVSSNDMTLKDLHKNILIYYIFITIYTISQLHNNKFSYKDSGTEKLKGKYLDKSEVLKVIEDLLKYTNNKDRIFILFLEVMKFDLKMNFSNESVNSYLSLKKLIYQNHKVLSKSLLMYYVKRMISFCAVQNVKGIDRNIEIFENYKFIIEKELFSMDEGSKLTLNDFKLIVSCSLQANKSEWFEEFLNSKLNLADKKLKKNIFHFGYASLNFYRKDYESALENISKMKYEFPPLNLEIYLFKAKIFYELDLLDSAKSVADSFRHYITKNKLYADFLKTALKNFLQYYKKLMKLKSKPHMREISTLVKELQKNKIILEKNWLMEKANEF